MSDRQVLAEHGLGLCLAAMAPWAAPVTIPLAVLGAFLLDLRGKCDKRLARTAMTNALTVLANTPATHEQPRLTDNDISTARAWLDDRRADLNLTLWRWPMRSKQNPCPTPCSI